MVMERMQILVTPEQRAWLEAESRRRGQPVTSVIRSSIDAARGFRPVERRVEALDRLFSRPQGRLVTFDEMEVELSTRYRSIPQ